MSRSVDTPTRPKIKALEDLVSQWGGDCSWRTTAERVIHAARNDSLPSYGMLATIPRQYIEQRQWPTARAEEFLRLVLYELAVRLLQEPRHHILDLPAAIANLRVEAAHRILEGLSASGRPSLDTQNDYFQKDLALLAGLLLPVGAELIQPWAGIPRSILWRGGATQFGRALRYFFLQRRPFQNYGAFHLDDRTLQEFNPDGWRQTYLRIATLLAHNPSVSGVFGSAWFYDPEIARISPHLAYLRRVREAGGAVNFLYGSSPGTTATALARSSRRRSLYQQRQYSPRAYYLIWYRHELLAWARSQPTTTRSR